MKKIIYMAVAAIAVLSSCSSDIEPTDNDKGKEVLKFTAKMEGSATRATLNGLTLRPEWEVGDVISIDGHAYSATTAGPVSEFTGTGATEATHHAYFPASLYNGGNPTLPGAVFETWTEGKFDMPMYAESAGTELEFSNLCGVLAITVTSEQIDAVKVIKVSSANKAISGAFTVDANNAAVLTDASNAANKLSIFYENAVTTTAEGKVFYVPVPAQTYQELKIELGADNTGLFTKIMTTKIATDITIERNNIYSITFADNTTRGLAKRTGGHANWVQLWAGGPKFAEYNIGATAATFPGTYLTFAQATQQGDNYAWGANWCTPSKEDLEELLKAAEGVSTKVKCEYVQDPVKGFKFTGKEIGYTSNSVFFPISSSNQYWSATASGTRAWCLNLRYFDTIGRSVCDLSEEGQNSSFRVRPVLKN